MKKIIIFVLTLFSILLLNLNQAHAFTLNSTYIEPNRAVFEYNESNGQYAVYIWDNYSTINDQYYQNIGVIGQHVVNENITRVYSFRPDVNNFIEIYYPTYERIQLIDLQYLVIEYIGSADASYTFYNNLGVIIQQFNFVDITNGYPIDYPVFVGYRVQIIDDEAYNAAFDAGEKSGYNSGRRDYGYFDGTDYITASDYGDLRYDAGYETGRSEYGIYINGEWVNAIDWGDTRYDAGVDYGQDNEIDWWSWATTFFLMPFKILNIQVLPGIRIGYFALFSLLLGVVGWFFFIVGKGGGKRK